jgi:hypothetical protein
MMRKMNARGTFSRKFPWQREAISRAQGLGFEVASTVVDCVSGLGFSFKPRVASVVDCVGLC